MAPRIAQAVTDMNLDEVSLVDRPANPHASIVIAKSYQGATMPQLEESPTGYYWEDGSPVAEDDEIGPEDEVFDAEGNVYGLTAEALAEIEAAANQGELQEVGKSAFGRSAAPVQKSLAQELSDQLRAMVSKGAGADDETRSLLSKAVTALQHQERETAEATRIAKSERDIRLTREYVAKAASYGEIPGVSAEELGPILKRCEELLPKADCVVLNKAFEATGGVLFQELGRTGGGTETGDDPMAIVEAAIEGQVGKGAGASELSKAQKVEAYFAEHPEGYDEYMAGRYGA